MGGGEEKRAYSRALKLLSYKPRSCQEIREYLHAKGFSSSAVDGALSELLERGLLDDSTYARALVDHAQRLRRGKGRVYQELRARGIDRTLAEEVVQSAFDLDKETEDASLLIAARISRCSPGEREEALEKALGLLARRGFSTSSITRAMKRFHA